MRNDLRFTLEAGKVIGIPLEQAPQDFHGHQAKRLMGTQIYFCYTPPGQQITDVDLSERFSCPVCHKKNYNREWRRAVYNLLTNFSQSRNEQEKPENRGAGAVRARTPVFGNTFKFRGLLNLSEVNVDNSLETQIGRLLRERSLKLATAESCTGGLIGNRLTDIPGSSEYFLGGVVAYAYEAKAALLGVSWDTLNSRGAVSQETALEMAHGVRGALTADVAVSVTGIAGPGGGTAEKPVGTTWIGLVAKEGEWTRFFQFLGDRGQNKASSANAALQMLLDYLTGMLR